MGNVVAAATAAARRDSMNNEDNSRTKDGAEINKDSQRDIPVKFSDNIHRDSNTNEHMYTTDQIEPIKNKIDEDDDTYCHGTSLESNTSSAPLSLPSRFITEYDSLSYSFDSTTHQHQSPLSLQTRHTSLMKVDSSPQSSYDCTTTTSRKRTMINFNDDVDRTPKKSNITTSPNNSSNQYESIPISSLSYNQLVQLQQETIPSSNNLTNDNNTNCNNNIISPSLLRQSVLSLTVALTSHHSNSKARIDNNNIHEEGRGVWMPRLLRNTHIKK
jgi:hypothetical protein